MLDKEKHQLIMGRILRDIYTDISLSPLIGLKGGTCAYFFYDLPRFSVDLDFDLFNTEQSAQQSVFEKIQSILSHYGTVKDENIKRFTIFFLLLYGDTDHNIKIEINVRQPVPHIREHYSLTEHLGIPMMAARRDYLFAGKLAALTLRKNVAMRDIYDIWFFAKNSWDINDTIVTAITGKDTKTHLGDCIAVIERVNNNQILGGLGELIHKQDKEWAKKHLRTETIFLLKNYQAALTRS